MKAIQIKCLSATNTKSSRLKAWTNAGSIITGFGTLPNGDYVATIAQIVITEKAF